MGTEVRREFRVFMASPGDLTDERDALRALERRMNAMLRDRGARISIEGWEEVQPDAGAPQDQINPLVYDCDVFIGLLNMRWGTPTDNDSSGFSEEFNIALERRKGHGAIPGIGMFFRTIDPNRLRDPGPQLEKVLAFKERVETERLLLHKSFENADQLALEAMNFLMPYMLRLIDEISTGDGDDNAGSSGSVPADVQPGELESADPENEGPEEDDEGPEVDSAQRQIVSALTSFSNAFATRAPLDPEARDRVTLAAAAFAKDGGVLGAHLVNRLFAMRADVDLTVGEVRIWHRTFFENYGLNEREYRTIPIWGVIEPDRLGDQFLSELGALAADKDLNVVRGVLRYMAEHQIRPASYWEPNPADSEGEGLFFESRTPEKVLARWVRLFKKFPEVDQAMNYVMAVGLATDVELLSSVADSEELEDRTRELVRIAAAALSGECSSVAELAPSRYSGHDRTALRKLVVEAIPGLSAEQWDGLLTGKHREISVAAALELVEHEVVTAKQLKTIVELGSTVIEDAIVERATRDPEWAVTKIAELVESDKHRNGRLVSRILAASVSREVLERLDRNETLSATNWVALTLQDPDGFVKAAREVLDDTATWLIERNAPLVEQYNMIAIHTTATAKGGACVVLAAATDFTDEDVARVLAELRRDFYTSRHIALRALITMLCRIEEDPDRSVPDLGDLSVLDSYSFSDDIDLVLGSPLAKYVVPVWRTSSISTFQTASHTWNLRQVSTTEGELEEALYIDDEVLRMVALDQLMARWNDEELDALLDRYGKQDRAWWYNIVAALDERLYGYGRHADHSDHFDQVDTAD